ncbi:methylenetetrahydrofolate reductase [Homoserinibacter gongjuensis]|uniref:Methylenetetrahydrofolate reductase n=1 Tax=Homoserinibacter gongjuensis TaxID=1162968 RepID=A0ABQ6JRJ4_9MICO|nr:methylenetetrahydrofolate reductase [Homoserinibacter gongjuensis]
MDAAGSPAKDASRALLAGFSLEMTGKDIPGLDDAAALLPPGTRVNVTFLGNEDLEMRLAAARAVQAHGLVPVPHISARRLASHDALEEFLARLQEAGLSEHVFVVGGDPATPEGPYASSLDVIRTGILGDYGVREVNIAGYPEGHPDIPEAELWAALEHKTAALAEQGLASVIITQFAFDLDAVLAWIAQVRQRGIRSLIRVGTPGPAGIKRLLAFASRFGIGANAMIVRKYGFSLTNLMGTAGPEKFVAELGRRLATDPAAGEVALHFYTFGGLPATAEWVRSHGGEGS